MTTPSNKRKLVSIRTIDTIETIKDADAIELAVVGGWKVVCKKNEFRPHDQCLYFEIDSFLPDGNPSWQFLVDKSSRMFQGVKGHKLRTVRLRGQISQGLILPLSALPEVDVNSEADIAEQLNVVKWEAEIPSCLAGQMEGVFPTFAIKSDQERCQNLSREIFGYQELLEPIDINVIPPEEVQPMLSKGILITEVINNVVQYFKVSPPVASIDDRYEVTMKLDGSSCTMFHYHGDVGVCSRNYQMKVNDANKDNSFVKMLVDSGLKEVLPTLGNIAIQGELMGPNIQGNREKFSSLQFFVYDMQLLDEKRFMSVSERQATFAKFEELGVNMSMIHHVPILHNDVTLSTLGISNVQDLLKKAEGPSIVHSIREGLVFKRMDGQFSFKAISNTFLAKEKD
jgi:hypothetical protein